MTKIPFFDLKEQNRLLENELRDVFLRQAASASFILGKTVEDFEKNFAHFTGASFAVGVNSGLDALSLSLRVLGVGAGDEVALPANSFIATALAVTSVGATPVFVDAEPKNLLIDLASVEKSLSKKTKVVIPVHLYGQVVDMKSLQAFCKKRKLSILEDACQAHGASMGSKRCGNFGNLAAFSFYPGKNLGAFGDGGMVTTDNKKYCEKLRLLRNYGSVVKYKHTVLGFNTRLDSLQAAILNIKLPHLAQWNKKRQILARRYEDKLKHHPELTLIPERKGFSNAHHLYIVRLDRRDALKKYLAGEGIETGIHYPVPIHQQEAYTQLKKRLPVLPVAEKEAKRVLSLPIYPEMSLKAVDQVCKAIGNFLKNS